MRTNGFSGAAPTASAARLDAILLKVSIISVTGPGVEIGLSVIVRPLVLILDEEANGGSESDPVLCARLNLHEIFLISLSDGESVCDHLSENGADEREWSSRFVQAYDG